MATTKDIMSWICIYVDCVVSNISLPFLIHKYGFCFKSHLQVILKVAIYMFIANPGEITPSYILHTRAFGTYLLGGGLFTLQIKKDYKVMVFYM
jgi:hypothetical protein